MQSYLLLTYYTWRVHNLFEEWPVNPEILPKITCKTLFGLNEKCDCPDLTSMKISSHFFDNVI